MIGIEAIDEAVTALLINKGADAKWRMWKLRHKRDELSLYVKISLLETYTDKQVVLTIQNKLT